MENRIREYIEQLFADIPETEKTAELKKQLLHRALDRYHDAVMDRKKPEIAYKIAIDEIGDVEELLAAAEKSAQECVQMDLDDEKIRRAAKKSGILCAVAVFLYINCITPALLLPGGLVNTVAPVLMFLMIAVATLLLAYNKNTCLPRYVGGDAADGGKGVVLRIIGILLIVCAVVPAVFAGTAQVGTALLLLVVGLGVGCLIYGKKSTVQNADSNEQLIAAYQKLEKKQTPTVKKLRICKAVVWLIAVALYMIAITVVPEAWYGTWMIFLLAMGICGIINGVIKKDKVALIIWIVASLLFALVLAGSILGASWNLGGFKLNAGTVTYDNAEMYNVGSAEITDSIDALEINWTDGTVDVQPYDGSTVQITEDEGYAEGGKLRYYLDGGKLIVQYCKSNLGISDEVPHDKNLIIKIPGTMAKKLTDIEVASTSADISLKGLTAETMSIDKISGNISCEDCQITTVDISTVSADCDYSGSSEAFSFDTTSGNLVYTASAGTWPQKLTADTVSGNVEMNIPADMPGFTASLSSVSTYFKTDFFAEESKSGYCFGNGTAQYEVNTISGQFSLMQLK